MAIEVRRVPKSFRVRLRETSPLSADPESVQRIWDAELARRPAITNGALLRMVALEEDTLWVTATDYRHFLAQLRGEDLGITTVAVSGLLLYENTVAFGQRDMSTTQDPGRWELVPSGGLERPDPIAQVLAELREETGLDPASVAHAETFALVQEGSVVDIGVTLEMRDWKVAHERSDEYRSIERVPLAAVADFVDGKEIVAVSRALLELRGYLPPRT